MKQLSICILILQTLCQFADASEAAAQPADPKLAAYADFLQMVLDERDLQQYFYHEADGSPYPVIVVDDLLSSSSDMPTVEKFGKPVRYMTKAAADSANVKAYFVVTSYETTGTIARIELKYPVRNVSISGRFRKGSSGWRSEWIEVFRYEHLTEEQMVNTYEDILRLALNEDTLQPYFVRQADGTPCPVVVADDVFSSGLYHSTLEKFGQPVKFITKEAVDSINVKAYFWISDYSYIEEDVDAARIILRYPIQKVYFGFYYRRTPAGWHCTSTYIGEI